jgi:hypothetical protein
MEYAYAICFWFVLSCGMVALSCGVFALVAHVVGRVVRSGPVIVMPESTTTSTHYVEPVRPWPRVAKETEKETPKGDPRAVTCGKCRQQISTGPVRTDITDAGPALIFNCPTCGEVAVPLRQG